MHKSKNTNLRNYIISKDLIENLCILNTVKWQVWNSHTTGLSCFFSSSLVFVQAISKRYSTHSLTQPNIQLPSVSLVKRQLIHQHITPFSNHILDFYLQDLVLSIISDSPLLSSGHIMQKQNTILQQNRENQKHSFTWTSCNRVQWYRRYCLFQTEIRTQFPDHTHFRSHLLPLIALCFDDRVPYFGYYYILPQLQDLYTTVVLLVTNFKLAFS